MSQESEIRVKEATSASEGRGIWKWKEGDVVNRIERRAIGKEEGVGRGPVVNTVEAWSKGEKVVTCRLNSCSHGKPKMNQSVPIPPI